MSQNDIWYIVAAVVSVCSILWGTFSFFYYRGLIHRMSKMLQRYQSGIWGQEALAETRESKLEAQLRRLLRQSSASKEQAKKDRESLAGLLADLSHQLKTPLANVVMDTELLQEANLSCKERISFSSHAAAQAAKMQWLLSALLKASRLEHGIWKFEASLQSIRQTLALCASAVYAQAQEKKIMIEMTEFEDRKLYHNRKWTAEAVTNILENAVKYSPRGSVVSIDAVSLEMYTRIDVYDEGPGVSPEECTKIFQRFYRSSNVCQEEGSGLGLYLAQVILLQEKGYITCSCNPRGGSCFSVFLLNDCPPKEQKMTEGLDCV